MRLSSLFRLTAIATTLFWAAGAPFALAQPVSNAPLNPDVPTNHVLAIGTVDFQGRPDALKALMPTEVADTVQLYLAGSIDQWFVRKDENGVVFLLNAASVEEAQAKLAPLPLVKNGFLHFQLIPLGPLNPLRYLLKDKP